MSATRRKIKDILDNLSGMTVVLGMYYPEDDEAVAECFNAIKLYEPQLIICPAKQEGWENHLKTNMFSVKLMLYFAYANFESFDYTELEDLMEAILHELTDMDNYDTDDEAVSVPYEIEPFEKKSEHKADPRVLLSECKLVFKGNRNHATIEHALLNGAGQKILNGLGQPILVG